MPYLKLSFQISMVKKHTILRTLILWIVALIALTSCAKIAPKGKIVSSDEKVEDFVNLEMEGKFRAFYVKSDSSYVNIETYSNFSDNLKIKVEDKTLKITERRETSEVDFYNVTVYSKYNLEKLTLKDSVELNTSSTITTDNFKLNLKKNAKFIGAINARSSLIEMSEKSRANFTGKSKIAVIKISDTASLIAPYWMIANLKIDSKNENYTEVNVLDSIKGDIKNTSKFLYYNNPIRAFKIEKTAEVQNKILTAN